MTAPEDPGRRWLLLCVLLVVLLALLPLRFVRWVSDLEGLVQPFVAPVAWPFRSVANWIHSPPRASTPETQALRVAHDEAERYRTRVLQLEDELRRLNELFKEMNLLVQNDPGLKIRHLLAPVYGTVGDAAAGVRVRAGESDGVTRHTVAVASGLQLVGRVVSTQARTCAVLPITSRQADQLGAIIMTGEGNEGLQCVLRPVGNGTLRGDDVEHKGGRAIEPQPGQLVRLFDETWPKSATMLIVGRVESVEPSARTPGRKTITVRPTIDRLERVSEVILRIPPEGADDTRGGGPR